MKNPVVSWFSTFLISDTFFLKLNYVFFLDRHTSSVGDTLFVFPTKHRWCFSTANHTWSNAMLPYLKFWDGGTKSVQEFIHLRMTGRDWHTNVLSHSLFRHKGRQIQLPDLLLASKWIHFIHSLFALPCTTCSRTTFKRCWSAILIQNMKLFNSSLTFVTQGSTT